VAHVFISYKHDDSVFANHLKEQLQDAGFETWIDDNISPGEQWGKAIDDAIKASFALIVIVTPKAKSSEFVTYEWSFALGNGVAVIPLLAETTDFHPKLSELQYVDYTQPAKQQANWTKLTARLKQIQDSVPAIIAPNPVEPDTISELTVLFDDLQSPDHETRRKAAKVLGQIGDPNAIPYLVKALEDEAWSVRADAAEALGEIGDRKVVTHLLRALRNSTSILVNQNIVWAFGKIKDERAVSALAEVAQFGKNKALQRIAVNALGKIGSPDAIDAIAQVAAVPYVDIEVRKAAIQVLGSPDDDTASVSLYGLLDDNNAEISTAAAHALEVVGTTKALTAVVEWREKQIRERISTPDRKNR
jgi:TIR domain/HEAT repeats/PBS lyase HEAT-like repeat